jgi:hypothetical protein
MYVDGSVCETVKLIPINCDVSQCSQRQTGGGPQEDSHLTETEALVVNFLPAQFQSIPVNVDDDAASNGLSQWVTLQLAIH